MIKKIMINIKIKSIISANIVDGNRPSETAIEDVFIRRFILERVAQFVCQ